MRAIVDESCIGCGLCEELCPEVFKVVDGLAVVQVDPVPDDARDACREAEDACPVTAISLE
jgi:ferredoxin